MIKLIALLFLFTSVLMLQTQVHGSCTFSPAQVTEIGSKEIVTCEYEGVKLMEGSSFKTTDCFSCICYSRGLSCCGFGIKAGVISVPSGFKVIQNGCDFKIVKEGDIEESMPIDKADAPKDKMHI